MTTYDADLAVLIVQFEAIVKTAQRLGANVSLSLHNADREAFDTAVAIDRPLSEFVGNDDGHTPFWSKYLHRVNGDSLLSVFTHEPPENPTHDAWHLEGGDLLVDRCFACWLEARRRAEVEAAA